MSSSISHFSIIAIVNDAYQSVNAISELVFWDHRFDYLSEVDGLIQIIDKLSRHMKHRQSTQETNEDPLSWRFGNSSDKDQEMDLFERIITCHSITSCLDFLDLLAALLALTFLLVTGIVLLGIPWPRSGKRYSYYFDESFHLHVHSRLGVLTHLPSVHSPKNDLLS